MLIGITGLAGSGKSEVARILVDHYGFERVKFADPFKNMLRTMLRDIGHCESDVERYLEGDLKETIVDGIGVTARRLMVTLGTEWGRRLIGDDLWIRLWAERAACFPFTLADDVRFANEVETIEARGGIVWRVNRPGVGIADHPSEWDIPNLSVTRTIHNVGSLGELHEQVHWLAANAGLA